MAKAAIDAYFVCGGKYHDIDYARLQLLGLLGEHERVRTRIAEDYSDIAAIEARAQSIRLSYPGEARLLSAAAIRLRALSKCLAAVHEPRIYAALAEEIDLTVIRLRRSGETTLGAENSTCGQEVPYGPLQLRLSHVWS